jgi:hypothetical protein
MTAGRWTLLSNVVDAFPEGDQTRRLWSDVLNLGDPALVFPAFSKVMWVIPATAEQELVFLALAARASYMFNRHVQIVSLGMFTRLAGCQTVEDAARHVIEVGNRGTPPEGKPDATTDATESAGDGDGPAPRDQGGTDQGPVHRGGEPEGDAGRPSGESRSNLS